SVELDEIRQRIEETVKKGKAAQTTTGPHLPYTSRAKTVLELAMSEARELNHSYVGTEHRLLALLGEGKGIAAQTLHSLGVTAENARAQTLSILGTSSDDPPSMPERALRSTTNAPPEGVAPLAVDLVLRYGNGA